PAPRRRHPGRPPAVAHHRGHLLADRARGDDPARNGRMTAGRVLLIVPPMTQLNTPYPSTAYLTGFLRSRGVDAVQEDLALKLVLRLLCPAGLDRLHELVQALPARQQ